MHNVLVKHGSIFGTGEFPFQSLPLLVGRLLPLMAQLALKYLQELLPLHAALLLYTQNLACRKLTHVESEERFFKFSFEFVLRLLVLQLHLEELVHSSFPDLN